MGQLLHDCARTTTAVRRAIQHSQESLLTLAGRYDLNPKTVQKWRKRSFAHDAPMGPKQRRSTTLSIQEEAVCVAFRKHTLLALDDCLYALQSTMPQLTRSALHRCFQRHGISRLPELEGHPSRPKKKFKAYPIGYFHIDLTEVRTQEGKLWLFVAVDRTSKFAFAWLVERATRTVAADFLQALIELVPYKIHTVLTDNGTHFTSPGSAGSGRSGHQVRLGTRRTLPRACLRSRLCSPRHRSPPSSTPTTLPNASKHYPASPRINTSAFAPKMNPNALLPTPTTTLWD